jgi:hypothetical protein
MVNSPSGVSQPLLIFQSAQAAMCEKIVATRRRLKQGGFGLAFLFTEEGSGLLKSHASGTEVLLVEHGRFAPSNQ